MNAVRKDGTSVVVLCVISRKSATDPGVYLPMAELNSNGVDEYQNVEYAEGELQVLFQDEVTGYEKVKKIDGTANPADGS